MNHILHILHIVVVFLTIFLWLNSGFIVGYVFLNWRKLGSRIVEFAGRLWKLCGAISVRITRLLVFARQSVFTLVNQIKEERSHAREISIGRCINCLNLTQIRFSMCPANAFPKIGKDLSELMHDLRRLRDDPTDDLLYDLVQTKMSDLKFQFSRSLMLADNDLINRDMRQALEEQLAEANSAINGVALPLPVGA